MVGQMLKIEPVRIEARVRNNRLWHAIFDKWRFVAAFCRQYRFSYSAVGNLLNLKRSPFLRDGRTYCKICRDLSKVFKILPEDLFPAELYHLPVTEATIEYHLTALPLSIEMLALPAPDTFFEAGVKSELQRAMRACLASLTCREEEVLKQLFFQGKTFDEVASKFGVGRARIYQIEVKALRKLRSPARRRGLQQFFEDH